MKYKEIKFTAAAVIFLAFIYYIAEPYEIAAAAIPILIHELGHIAAIKILGLHIKDFRAELKGFCIDYYGSTGSFGHILIAASGPAAGFIYAYALSEYDIFSNAEFENLSSGISLILSLFNLLPVFPLDGGRISAEVLIALFGEGRGGRYAEILSTGLCILVMAAALYLLINNNGAALMISAIWLLFYQESAKGIVKRREIL